MDINDLYSEFYNKNIILTLICDLGFAVLYWLVILKIKILIKIFVKFLIHTVKSLFNGIKRLIKWLMANFNIMFQKINIFFETHKLFLFFIMLLIYIF